MKDTTKIENNQGLLEIKVQTPPYSPNHSYSFRKGQIRKKLEEMEINPSDSFNFLTTVVNPNAAKLIDKNSEELSMLRYGKNSDMTVRFDASLMDVYLDTLKHLSKQYLGIKNYTSYPLIKNEGVHNSNRHPDQPSWPIVHVIKGKENSEKLKSLVEMLNNDSAYEFIKEKEAPQNYKMGSINLLHSKKVDPIKLTEWKQEFDGATLRAALNFLSPYTYKEEWTGDHGYYD